MFAFEKSLHCFSLLPPFMSLPEPEALISCSEGVWVMAKPGGDQLSDQRGRASTSDLLHGLFPMVHGTSDWGSRSRWQGAQLADGSSADGRSTEREGGERGEGEIGEGEGGGGERREGRGEGGHRREGLEEGEKEGVGGWVGEGRGSNLLHKDSVSSPVKGEHCHPTSGL